MGKHARRFRNLPPSPKPRYRFVIALGTIALLAFAAMVVVAALYPENGPQAAAGSDAQAPVGEIAGPTGRLVAEYMVPPSAVWNTGFQAQITMTNTTPTPQDWQVRLSYAQSVTNVSSTWVDGQQQPIMRLGDQQAFTFSGTAPLESGETVVLKIQFDTMPQADIALHECTANGRPCQIN